MPTQKPRVALVLPDQLKVTLDAFAEALEKPTSTAIVGLLEEMEPQLRDLTKVILHAKAGKKGLAKRALQHMMGNALAEQLVLIKDGK